MVLSRSLAGANSGCSFKVDSYQRMAFSNSSCRQETQQPRHHQDTSLLYKCWLCHHKETNNDQTVTENLIVAITIAIQTLARVKWFTTKCGAISTAIRATVRASSHSRAFWKMLARLISGTSWFTIQKEKKNIGFFFMFKTILCSI